MWILDRLETALQRADLMFGSIAENGSLGHLHSIVCVRLCVRACVPGRAMQWMKISFDARINDTCHRHRHRIGMPAVGRPSWCASNQSKTS